MIAARTYTLQFCLVLFLLLAGTAAANYIIDPYGIYNVVHSPGFNANKPGQKGHDRLVKAYAIAAIKPDALLLGSSRVQYGLNPCDAALAKIAQRPYNGGLLGSNMYLALRYTQHAAAQGPLKVVVVGIDPLMFDERDADAARDFSEERLATDAQGEPQQLGFVTDVPATLLSWDTARLSLRTWRKQFNIVSDLLPGGQRTPAALQRLYDDNMSTAERFASVDRTYAHDDIHALWPSDSNSKNFKALDALLALAVAQHIRLELYFTPEHAHLHQVAQSCQQTDAIVALKQRIAAAVFAVQPHAAHEAPITLWAMDGLTPYTTEPVPPDPTSRGPLTWFWEPTHAREVFGHLILERMLSAQPSEAAKGVGEPLTPASLTAHLAKQREGLFAWQRANPRDVQAIGALCTQEAERLP